MLYGITAGKSQFINPLVCTVGHKYFWIPPNVKLPMNTTLILSLSLYKTETSMAPSAFSETFMIWNTFTSLLYITHTETYIEVYHVKVNMNLPHWNCGHGLWSMERHTSLAGTQCVLSLHGLGSHGSLSEQLPNSKSPSFSPAHLPHKQLWFSCLWVLWNNTQNCVYMHLWEVSYSQCIQCCVMTKIQ